MRINGASNPPTDTNTPPPMNFTRLSDGSLAKGLLLKIGSDENHVAAAGASDSPIGISNSAATGAEQPVIVSTLNGVLVGKASTAVTAGAVVEAAASGQIAPLGGGVGVHHIVGIALEAAGSPGDSLTFTGAFSLREI